MTASTRLLLGLVRAYRAALAPFFTPCCRFEPSCSAYAEEALSRHGAWRGGRLAVGRICRCHPFARAGFDPVPVEAARIPAGAGQTPAGAIAR